MAFGKWQYSSKQCSLSSWIPAGKRHLYANQISQILLSIKSRNLVFFFVLWHDKGSEKPKEKEIT